MVQQITTLKNKKEEKSFKDAVFLEGELEKIVERVYEINSMKGGIRLN
jgi:hypothetical protein